LSDGRLRASRGIENLGDPKIQQLGHAFIGHENITRLDVAMDY